MNYVQVRNLEKFHPGYRDRKLQWAKIYCSIVQGDPEFELIDNEIDKWRFIAIVLLQLQAQKPLPDEPSYWQKKGFDLKKRSMSLTLQMLHNFLDTVTESGELCNVDKIREDKIRVDKSRVEARNKPEGVEKVTEYFSTISGTPQDAQAFFDFFTSNGWLVSGRSPMRDWKAAARNWMRNKSRFAPRFNSTGSKSVVVESKTDQAGFQTFLVNAGKNRLVDWKIEGNTFVALTEYDIKQLFRDYKFKNK